MSGRLFNHDLFCEDAVGVHRSDPGQYRHPDQRGPLHPDTLRASAVLADHRLPSTRQKRQGSGCTAMLWRLPSYVLTSALDISANGHYRVHWARNWRRRCRTPAGRSAATARRARTG